MSAISTWKFSDVMKKSIEQNGKHTPDIPYLNQFENHYVFVYGTLKSDCSRNYLLSDVKDNEYCGEAVTVKDFELLFNPYGNYPVLVKSASSDKNRRLKVKGELWLVDSETIISLDHIERNGDIFDRVWTKVWVGKVCIDCFVYLGRTDYWNKFVLIDYPPFDSNGKLLYDYSPKVAAILSKNYLAKQEVRGV